MNSVTVSLVVLRHPNRFPRFNTSKCKTASRIIRRKQSGGFYRQQFLITTGSFRRSQGLKSSSINLPKWRRRRYIVESEYEDRDFLSNSFWSISIFFHCLDYWSTFSPWSFATKVGKKSPIKLWHQSTKISFWGCDNHYVFSSGEFHWRLCTEFCPAFETMNE